ncbi:type I-E CRISPR-associated protein Cse1/CasA [Dactylosporangium aurantiacum]|uniref:type I-E CRISPR-associated protein Cse1/CasA n=1 Tax=Dactylosporangium aurantiacum TaxID=35754 RepID=UPI00138DE372|nr:type I-E CRISPR-associated protein Cse1/CasA [Dactylosporangium aurantiacum]MDG6108820.1 type I-E CRISPR-associated protein Cse1/CasA [Dactylosporangium aurantiacum]
MPVYRDGSPVQLVGLQDLLQRAHEWRDLAEPNPLIRAGLRRFLTALTALLVRRTNTDADHWTQRMRDNSGFTVGEVRAVLDELQDRLWLYHPVSPFLQDPRLIEASLKPELKSFVELAAHLPGEGETAWFTKGSDPDMTGGLPPMAAARALVGRWYYTLNGNTAEVRAEGRTISSQQGSTFGEGPARLTHVFRVAGSLFGTLLRNLTTDLVIYPGTSSAGVAWADGDQPGPYDDPLYRYTMTGTSVLLGPPASDGRVVQVLRGPVPADPDRVKLLRESARDADPHRILIEGRTPGSQQTLRLSADDHRIETLNALRRPGWPGNPQLLSHGVISEERLWLPAGRQARHAEILELLLADKQGAATAPKWKHTATVTLSSVLLDPELTDLDGLLTACFAGTGAIEARLIWAVRLALARIDNKTGKRVAAPLKDGPVATAAGTARRLWLDAADRALDQVRAGQLTELQAQDQLWAAARTALRTATAPYAATTRYAASTITADRVLWRKPT